MSPIEHYFENLLTIGSDIKFEPNKNALSREVQEAIDVLRGRETNTHLVEVCYDLASEMISLGKGIES